MTTSRVERWDEAVLGPLSKAKRRRVEQLASQVDRDLEADRRYFRRRPERTFRIRHAFRSEVDELRLVGGLGPDPEGQRLFAAVRQVESGVRMRAFFRAARGLETDMSEFEAASIWAELDARDPRFAKLAAVLDAGRTGARD